jgi:hypothetical protein
VRTPRRRPAARDAARPALLDEGGHPEWCAGGHRCGLGEHRADPVIVDVDGVGRLVLTRVQGRDGRQHADVRVTAELVEHEGYARLQLARLVERLTAALGGR